VDYEDAIQRDSSDIGDDEESQNIAGVLLDEFVKRKRHIIEEEYDDIKDFKEIIKDAGDSRERLMKIYTKYLWAQKKDGEEFTSDGNADEKIVSISDEHDVILEEVNDTYRVLWPSQDTIDKEVNEETNEVIGRKYLRAKPVIIKKTDDGFEVRGRAQDKKALLRDFRSNGEVDEKEPEQVSESIAKQIEKLLTEENQFFKITGIEFSESELPGNSQLKVKNESSVYSDVETLKRVGLISLEGMSEIRKLYLQDKESGNNFRITVTHRDQGFEFELVAPRKLDSERERFKDNFVSATDIAFDKLYDYSSQADEPFLVNRILVESADAYEKYYEELGSEAQELIDELVETSEERRKICRACSNQVGPDEEECAACGNDDFFEPIEQLVVEVNERQAFDLLFEVLESCSPTHDKLSIQEWEIERDSFGSSDSRRRIGLASFHGLDIERDMSTSSYGEIYFVPLGNRQRPRQLDDYLLESVFLTYGGSRTKRHEGFGHLSLYDLLLADDVDADEVVGEAVYTALIGVQERVFRKSRGARNTGSKLLRRMDVDSIADHRGDLSDIYKRNKFEKHVFYLLKGMFPFSERMGKEGKREPDSVLISPLPDGNNYYVATCDAKLSYRENGYDLDSGEEDKATRYSLAAAQNERILNKTDDVGPSAHIFISQNFKHGQFDKVSENIRENLQNTEQDDVDDIQTVFMEFQGLIDLFQFYERYWNHMNDPRIRDKFHAFTIEELEGDGDYVHFDSDSVASIREKLLDRVDGLADSPVSRYSQ
jgi:RNA polymerase subunit RPABC4/transcription elongation factor Spt4